MRSLFNLQKPVLVEVCRRGGSDYQAEARLQKTHLLKPFYCTFTPVSMPVVETLKSRYANISDVGGL